MVRSKWFTLMILVAAGGAGFFALGFAGMLILPIAVTAGMVWWRRRQAPDDGLEAEEARLKAFIAAQAQSPQAAGVAPASALPPVPGAARKPAFEEMKLRVAGLGGDALTQAVEAARQAQAANPRDAHAAVEAALLARRAAPGAGQVALRAQAVAKAILACLAQGQAPMAAALFVEAREDRNALKLDPSQWEALGRLLLGRGAYMEAAWSLHAGALLAGDATGAQKRLIEVAGKAAEADQPALAHKLYGTLLAKYPASSFAEFARTGMHREEKKLGKG